MRAVVGMVAACLGSAIVVIALAGNAVARDVVVGMLGPLVAASGTWLFLERASRTSPDRVTSTMFTGFVVKMLFFGVYVVTALKVLDVHAAPFVVSFTCYFVSLYAVEAVLLGRLVSRAAR